MFKPWEKLILISGALCIAGQFAFTSENEIYPKEATHFASK